MSIRSSHVAFSAVLGLGILAAGCAGPRPVPQKEALLTSAGFERREADTPKRQAMMDRLPPNKIIQRHHKGDTVYVYANPAGCRCLYIGSRDAFERYERTVHGQEPVYANDDATWDWGAWGMSGWRD